MFEICNSKLATHSHATCKVFDDSDALFPWKAQLLTDEEMLLELNNGFSKMVPLLTRQTTL